MTLEPLHFVTVQLLVVTFQDASSLPPNLAKLPSYTMWRRDTLGRLRMRRGDAGCRARAWDISLLQVVGWAYRSCARCSPGLPE